MRSKKKNNNLRAILFLVLHCLFTVTCGCLSWIFPDQRVLLFQIWYQVTSIIWFVLAILVILFLIK